MATDLAQRAVRLVIEHPEILEYVYGAKLDYEEIKSLDYELFFNAIVHEEKKLMFGLLAKGFTYAPFLDNYHRLTFERNDPWKVIGAPMGLSVQDMQAQCDDMLCDVAFVKMLRIANGYIDY